MPVISVILALLPLLGIVYIIFFSGWGLTVDALFTSLILAAISGIFVLNLALEFLAGKSGSEAGARREEAAASLGGASSGATRVQRGLVQSVEFFESHVGNPPKSLVTLLDGSSAPRLLVFEGDQRNRLPAGKKVEVYYRPGKQAGVVLDVAYS
jgi:hypothetical protein